MRTSSQMLFRSLPLPNAQSTLLGTAFAALVFISAATLWLVDRAAKDATALRDTLEFQDKLSNVLLSVRRAESSQRGYLFTGDPTYLTGYYEAEPELKLLMGELRTMAGDDRRRTTTLDRAAGLVSRKFDEMARTIGLEQAGRRADARVAVVQGDGRAIMDALRSVLLAATSEEERLTAARTATSQTNNRILLYVTLFGAASIVLLGAVSISMVQRASRQRERAQEELATTNANLERIVQFRTADLIEANEEIQRFAHIVSHDLRSPLVNIMGFTSELESLRADVFERVESVLSEHSAAVGEVEDRPTHADLERMARDFDEAIGFIKTSIGNMDRLINAILKLSREGRRKFVPEPVAMKPLFESIAGTVAHRVEEDGTLSSTTYSRKRGRSSTPRIPPTVPATAPTVPPTTAPTGPAARAPASAPSAAPRTVPCACATAGSASIAASVAAARIFVFIGRSNVVETIAKWATRA